MRYQNSYLALFWRLPWSAPLRAALPWQADPDRFTTNEIPVVPRWLRPLFVQRWVGQAVAQRAAWLNQHVCLEPYRFGNDSDPAWHETALLRYAGCSLRGLRDEGLCWVWGMEVERILRFVQLSPAEIGEGAWLAAVLAASEHVAQVYLEWRRRYKAERARAIVREQLQRFLDWRSDEDMLMCHGCACGSLPARREIGKSTFADGGKQCSICPATPHGLPSLTAAMPS